MSTLYVDTINEKTSGNGIYMPGHVIQVVQGTLDTQVTVTSTDPTDSGLEATITPKSTSSKILITATCMFSINNNSDQSMGGGWQVTDGNNNVIMSSQGDSNPFDLGHYSASNWYNLQATQSRSFLHSPATTSAITYKVRLENGTGTSVRLNYVSGATYSPVSSIILQEIGG